MPRSKMITALKKRYPQAAVLAGSIVATGQAFALDAAQNTSITSGYTATETTVALIIAGLLTVALGLVGFNFIMGLLRR